jgi:hypothetical protein
MQGGETVKNFHVVLGKNMSKKSFSIEIAGKCRRFCPPHIGLDLDQRASSHHSAVGRAVAGHPPPV